MMEFLSNDTKEFLPTTALMDLTDLNRTFFIQTESLKSTLCKSHF